jgi:hypothetical protein
MNRATGNAIAQNDSTQSFQEMLCACAPRRAEQTPFADDDRFCLIGSKSIRREQDQWPKNARPDSIL